MEIKLTLNGREESYQVSDGCLLLQLLRREGCYSVKHGCETGDCGVCTVLLDGRPVVSCILLAAQADGKRVTTLEGLNSGREIDVIQRAFMEAGAIQCGYCTPAMIVVAKALLDKIPTATGAEIREALAGVLCRCTAYIKPVEAILHAAREIER